MWYGLRSGVRLSPPESQPWRDPATYWAELQAATAELDPPFGVISLPALAHNAHDMLRRAAGKPIRVASKSVRVRSVIEGVLELPGYAGVLAYTLPEALWLAETIDDIVVGYPTADREAIRALATNERNAARVTIMVDSLDQVDAVDAAINPAHRESLRVCLELDSSYLSPLLGRLGVYRSPMRTVEDAVALARAVIDRPGFTLVGIMSYEAQIAGLGNRPPGKPLLARVIDGMQARSFAELLERRPQTRVLSFGNSAPIATPFPYEDLGVLTLEQLAQTFTRASVGLVLSMTNYSVIPQEMLACGMPVVELAGVSGEGIFGSDGGVTFADFDPLALADALERLLDDRQEWQRRSAEGLAWAHGRTWDLGAEQIERGLREALRLAATPP